MSRNSLMTIWPLILLALCGCAPRTIAVRDCPKPPVLEAAQLIPGTEPLLFPQCLNEILAETSTPSCAALQQWLNSIEAVNR